MSSRSDSGSTFSRRRATLRALLAVAAIAALWAVLPERILEADAPPAATLVSPNGGTVTIGKPYFLWNKGVTATEYRLKVDKSSSCDRHRQLVLDLCFVLGNT